MGKNLTSRIVRLYQKIKNNRISVRIADLESRILQTILQNNYSASEMNKKIFEELIKKTHERDAFLNEILVKCVDNIEVSKEIRNRGIDTIDIVEEIRSKARSYDRRFRQLELYILHLMKHTGVSVESLAVEPSDSQEPATASDFGFLKLEITKGSVSKNINRIRALTDLECRDIKFLEHTLIPELGLAEEDWSFPPEIAHLSGKGLHLLQLPCQLAPLLAWLADNARGTESYLEIGVRWGGMFILISEWLRRFSPELRRVVAVDPAEMSPLIREYIDFTGKMDDRKRLEIRYEREYSTSKAAEDIIKNLKSDFVFIDGDHRYEGVSHDYKLVYSEAKMIMFHDICASNWPGVGKLWHEVLEENSESHSAVEFTKQYQSGDGGGMGLGVIKIKS